MSVEKKQRQLNGRGSQNGKYKSSERTNPAAVERYLKRIYFPASKYELIQHAEENKAPDDVLHVLGQFTDKDYQSVIDVAKEIGRIE